MSFNSNYNNNNRWRHDGYDGQQYQNQWTNDQQNFRSYGQNLGNNRQSWAAPRMRRNLRHWRPCLNDGNSARRIYIPPLFPNGNTRSAAQHNVQIRPLLSTPCTNIRPLLPNYENEAQFHRNRFRSKPSSANFIPTRFPTTPPLDIPPVIKSMDDVSKVLTGAALISPTKSQLKDKSDNRQHSPKDDNIPCTSKLEISKNLFADEKLADNENDQKDISDDSKSKIITPDDEGKSCVLKCDSKCEKCPKHNRHHVEGHIGKRKRLRRRHRGHRNQQIDNIPETSNTENIPSVEVDCCEPIASENELINDESCESKNTEHDEKTALGCSNNSVNENNETDVDLVKLLELKDNGNSDDVNMATVSEWTSDVDMNTAGVNDTTTNADENIVQPPVINNKLLKSWNLSHVDPIEFTRRINAVVSQVAATQSNNTDCTNTTVKSMENTMDDRGGVFTCLQQSLQTLEIQDESTSTMRSPIRADSASPQHSPCKVKAGLNNLKKLFRDSPALIGNSPKPGPSSEIVSENIKTGPTPDVKTDVKSRNIWDEFGWSTSEGKDVESKIAVSAESPQIVNRASTSCLFDNTDDNHGFLASDDSDDDLMETPSILINRSHRISGSPLHNSDRSWDLDDYTDTTFIPPTHSTSSKTTITLKSLLEDKRNQVKNEELYGAMEADLKSGIAKGGIRSMNFDNDSNELPEGSEQALLKLKMKESMITTQHPGEEIFIQQQFQQLFTAESLTLDSCGFTTSPTSSLDKCLAKLDYSMLAEYLDGDFILLCIHQLSTPHEFLNWLFKTVSIHDDYSVIRAGFHILYRVLMDGKCKDWAPSIKTIAEVFINYGASKERLSLEPEMLNNLGLNHLCLRPPDNIDPEDMDDFGMENIISVVQIIAYSVQKRSHLYSSDDLTSLMTIICKVSIDKSLSEDVMKYDFQVCLSMIIDAFKPETWTEEFPVLVENLSTLCENHHNQVHIIRLFPHGKRGYNLQRSIAYSTLNHRMLVVRKSIDGEEIKVSWLHSLLAKLRDSCDGDYYKLYSMVQIVDLCIGNETLPQYEKDSLYILTDIMRAFMSELRDNVHMIDCTIVKDLIVRIISKWTFMQQAMANVGKKRTLFNYFRPVDDKVQGVITVSNITDQNDDYDETIDDKDTECMQSLDNEQSLKNEPQSFDAEQCQNNESQLSDKEQCGNNDSQISGNNESQLPDIDSVCDDIAASVDC